MANFVLSGVIRTAAREAAAPIPHMVAFSTVIDDVSMNNPFGCTA